MAMELPFGKSLGLRVVRFPRLFNLSTNKSKTIADLGEWVEGNWVWV